MPKATEEKLLKSETVFEGKEIRIRRDTFETAGGAPVEKDIVERPFPEILIVPQSSEGEVLLVKQFRRGIKELLLELPGGKLQEGEEAETAARRELEEETGYRAEKLEKLGEAFAAPNWANSVHIFFLATGLTPAENPQAPDPDENIEVVQMPFAEALAKVESGEIRDAKTALGLFLAQKFF